MNRQERPALLDGRSSPSRPRLISELIVTYFIHGIRALDGGLRGPALQARPLPLPRQPSNRADGGAARH